MCFKFACLVVWVVLGGVYLIVLVAGVACLDWLWFMVCVVLFLYCWVTCMLIVLLYLFLNLWFCFMIM